MQNVRLIQSDEENPRIRVTAGRSYKVITTTIVDSGLDLVSAEVENPQMRPARLCGSRSTCVAIVEVENLD